eukprot:scaffold689_cov166-Pinguiococcus_pyrenoidosus.AAC.1
MIDIVLVAELGLFDSFPKGRQRKGSERLQRVKGIRLGTVEDVGNELRDECASRSQTRGNAQCTFSAIRACDEPRHRTDEEEVRLLRRQPWLVASDPLDLRRFLPRQKLLDGLGDLEGEKKWRTRQDMLALEELRDLHIAAVHQ